MMKRSKVLERRIDKAIEEKSNLLNNVDRADSLKIIPLESRKNPLVLAERLQIKYDSNAIFNPVSFEVNNGDRVALVGKNGAGKSSILKLILEKSSTGNENILQPTGNTNNLALVEKAEYTGTLKVANDLKISYISQSTEYLKGNLKEFVKKYEVEESIFKAILVKMGFSNSEFDKDINQMSEGQKKKILIAKSISEQANFYIWDEPLNYIDILTRIQIEEAILKYKPTLIFVEHDETFIKKISTKVIELKKNIDI